MDDRGYESLPCDLVVEILSRLPAKSLMRFKRVSKRWLSLITNPVFAELHYTRSYSRDCSGVFVTPTRNTDKCLMCIIDMKKEPFERVSILKPDIPYDNNRTSNIVNGLVCFYHGTYEKQRIYLYNLTTREYISLPSNHVQDSPERSSGRFSRTCALGFDPLKKEYKVLEFYSEGDNHHKMRCQVFTVGGQRKVWKPFDISHIQEFDYFTSQRGFCVDGFLYWRKEDVIIVFDIGLEIFKLIRFPIEKFGYFFRSTVVKVDGRLCLVYTPQSSIDSSTDEIQIVWWRLDEDKDTGELQWTKEVVTYEDHFLKIMDKLDRFNHLGQTLLVQHSPPSYLESSIIGYYDLINKKYEEFEVKNTRGILSSRASFRASEVIDNIMPLRIGLQCENTL